MQYIWKTKVCFFKQSLFVFFKTKFVSCSLQIKQNFVTYNNDFMKS